MPRKLTALQARFAEEFVVDLHATDALLRAGYKPTKRRHAGEIASRLLKSPRVQDRIGELQAEISRRTQISADRVLQEFARIGFANMADYTRVVGGERVLALENATRDQLAAVAEITVEDFVDGRGEDTRQVRRTKMKLHNKHAALASLAEHLGLFTRRLELTGKVTLEQLVAESFKPEPLVIEHEP